MKQKLVTNRDTHTQLYGTSPVSAFKNGNVTGLWQLKARFDMPGIWTSSNWWASYAVDKTLKIYIKRRQKWINSTLLQTCQN